MGKNYTTFQKGHGMDSYDRLEASIQIASKGEPVHILTLSKESFPTQESYEQRLRKISGIQAVCPVNGTINLVVRGEANNALAIANDVFEQTSEPVGIVRYEKQDMLTFYCLLKAALEIARTENGVHLYAKQDSLQYKIETALQELRL